jgi:hypothetical protein
MHHSFSKLEMILTLVINIKKKEIEIDSNIIIKNFFLNFEDVTLIKIIHFYVVKNMNAYYT